MKSLQFNIVISIEQMQNAVIDASNLDDIKLRHVELMKNLS